MTNQSDGDRNNTLLTKQDFVNTLVAIGSTAAAGPLLMGGVQPGSRSLMSFDSGRRSRRLEEDRGGCEVTGRKEDGRNDCFRSLNGCVANFRVGP